MIKLENINFKYKKNKTKDFILKDINLTINNGEFISIIGNNGEGKSTLLKLLSGIILPTEGNILINDINTKSKKDFINLRKNISIVFQNPDNQIIFERVYEELEFALKNLKFDKNDIDKQIDLALEKVNMLDFKFTNTENLSLGQKQKIIIAEALSTNSDIIVLDEPTAMLDPTSKRDFLNLLIDLNKQGKTIILVTHILDEIFYSSRCLYLNNNIIEEDFNISELFNNIDLLSKINKNNSNTTLNLLYSLIQNDIKINFNNYKKENKSFNDYLNNEIINLLNKNKK